MSTDKELKPRQLVEVQVKICNRDYRDSMVTALANGGYSVRVEGLYVVFDIPDERCTEGE